MTFQISTLSSVTCVIALLAGCRSTPRVQIGDSKASEGHMSAAADAGVQCSIKMITGPNGGPLVRGQKGWLCLDWRNTESRHRRISTAAAFGKGEGRELTPAWPAPASSFYAGVARMKFTYAFTDQSGLIVLNGELSPPDSPLVLAPEQSIRSWRLIDVPSAPGDYTFHVSANSCDLLMALRSVNFQSDDDEVIRKPFQLFVPVTVND